MFGRLQYLRVPKGEATTAATDVEQATEAAAGAEPRERIGAMGLGKRFT